MSELPSGTITFLLTDVQDSTPLWEQHPVEMRRALARHDELVEALIEQNNGHHIRPRGEGDSRFAVFVRAQDGVTAAIMMQQAFNSESWPIPSPLKIRIGIHTGEGEFSDGDYYGTSVNRCARIRGIANGGQIVLSQSTYELVRDTLPEEIDTIDLGEHSLKGLSRPEHVFQLVGPGFPSEFPSFMTLSEHNPSPVQMPLFLSTDHGENEGILERSVFVTRERELGQLHTLLDKVMDGKGCVTLISGEQGRGKTALTQELSRTALEKYPDMLIASGTCNSYSGIGDPYHPFKEIFSNLIGDVEIQMANGTLSRDHALRLWQGLPSVLSALLKRGPDLFNVFFSADILLSNAAVALPENDTYIQQLRYIANKQMDNKPDMQQSHLFGQCVNVFKLLSLEYPLMLVLDDLQWADAASTSLLFHLGHHLQGSRILIVGTYRSAEISLGVEGARHPLVKVINEFKRQYGDIIVELDLINPAEGRRFVDAYLDVEPNKIGAEFRDAFFKQTEGHPLFTVELLRDMKERGDLLKDQDGDWIVGSRIDWNTLPKRLDGAIAERIDRLEEPLRDILDVACVEGVDFSAQVTSSVLGVESGQVVRLLSRDLGQRHHLVYEKDERLVGQQRLFYYQFSHNLYQRYLYGLLSIGERRDLHGRIAHQLEELFQENRNEIAAQSAHHYTRAGDMDKAMEYLQLAGERALKQYAYQEAIDHLANALELSQRIDFGSKPENQLKYASMYSTLGRAYIGLGKITESREYLSRAVAILDRPIPAKAGDLILPILIQFITQLFHRVLPQKWIRRLLSETQREIHLESARVYTQLGLIYFLDNESLLTVYAALRTLNLAERVGPSTELAEAYATMCVATGLIPLHSLARVYQRIAIKTSQVVDTELTTVRVAVIISLYYIGIGEWTKARVTLEKASQVCVHLGDHRLWGESIISLANCYLLTGKISKSLELFDLMVVETRRWNNPLHCAWGLEGQANHALRMDKAADAIELLEESLNLLKENEDQVTEIEVLGLLGLAHLRQGDLAAARQAADSATSLLGQSSPTSYAFFQGLVGLSEVYLKVWEEALHSGEGTVEEKASAKKAYQSCKDMHTYARIFPIGKPLAWFYQGKYDWLRKQPQKAIQSWQKSLKEATQLEMPFEQGIAHLELGKHLGQDDPMRKEHLSQAEEIFKNLDAAYYLRSIRSL